MRNRPNHKSTKTHYKTPKKTNQVFNRLILLLLITSNSKASSIREPQKYTLAGKRFKSLYDFGLEGTGRKSIATTGTGEVYSVTKTINSPTQYTFEAKDSTATYPHTILNAIHLDKDHIFSLVKHTTSNKVNYQLFKAKASGGMDFKADAKASSLAEAKSSALADIVANHIEVLPLWGTKYQMIAIANTGIELLRFDVRNLEIVPYTGNAGYLKTTLKVKKIVLSYDVDSSKVGFMMSEILSTPAEIVKEGYVESTEIDYSLGLSIGSLFSRTTEIFKGLVCSHGIRYGFKGDRSRLAIESENMYFYIKEGSSNYELALLRHSNGAVLYTPSHELNGATIASYKMCGIGSVKLTRYVFSVLSGDCHYQGTTYAGSKVSWIYTSIQTWDFVGGTGVRVKAVYGSAHVGSNSLSEYSIYDPVEGYTLFVADFNDEPNILYLNDVLSVGCTEPTVRRVGPTLSVHCDNEDTVAPFCKKARGSDNRCFECNDPLPGPPQVTYSLIPTNSYVRNDHYSCKPSNVNCDNSAGEYIKPDGSGCYTCSTQIPGCTKCSDFSYSCQFDGCLSTHTFYVDLTVDQKGLGNCKTKCSYANCDVCHDQGGNPGCYICTNLFYSSSLTSCASCTNAGANCVKCSLSGNTCQQCAPGYFLRSVGNVFDTRECSQCPHGKVSFGAFCGDCAFTTPNPGCNDCELYVDSCKSCKVGYQYNSGTKMCTLGCDNGKYLVMGNPDPTCPTCISVDTTGAPGGSGNPNCELCADTTGVCTQCKTGYKLDSRKYCRPNNCAANEYWSLVDRQCTACSASPHRTNKCQGSTCQDETGYCNDCVSGFSLINNFCQIDCSADQYWKGTSDNNCEACTTPASGVTNPKCDRCSDVSGACTRCLSGYSVDSGTNFCKKDCNSNEYWKGVNDNNCESCAVPAPNGGCATCNGPNGCLTCLLGYGLDVNSRCISEVQDCPADHYLKSIANSRVECEVCSALTDKGPCTSCKGTSNHECKACEAGHSLKQDKYCQKDCEKDEYWKGKSDNSCGKCLDQSKNCLECHDVTGKCSKCEAGYTLNQQSGACSSASEDKWS